MTVVPALPDVNAPSKEEVRSKQNDEAFERWLGRVENEYWFQFGYGYYCAAADNNAIVTPRQLAYVLRARGAKLSDHIAIPLLNYIGVVYAANAIGAD